MSGECDKCGDHALECECADKPDYSISVYKHHAIIKGAIKSDIFCLLIKLCKKEGFTHLIKWQGRGFKLTRGLDDHI